MKIARKILIKIMGLNAYLSFVSKIYIFLTSRGCFKAKYPELFFLHTIVKPGDTCLDIGANLGYYSVKLSNIVGPSGKVYSVEPVPMFYSIWQKNTRCFGHNNLELFPYALGSEEKTITMGMPMVDGLAHHGMTKVATSSNEKYAASFEATMKIPDNIFSKITRLDFIKCDIEGYENVAFANMKETLARFKPLIQSELGGEENREKVIAQLESIGYKTCVLSGGRLQPADQQTKDTHDGDFYFLQEKHALLLK